VPVSSAAPVPVTQPGEYISSPHEIVTCDNVPSLPIDVEV